MQFTEDIGKLIFYCFRNEIGLTFGDAFRSTEQQQIYVDLGLSKTMNSKHLQRLAVDFNFFINGKLVYDKAKLQHIGDHWESLRKGNKWGGSFSFTDTPHFQAS